MRRKTASTLVAFLLAVVIAGAGEPSEWLTRAADPERGRREREYAVQQLVMLADSSASMFVSVLRGDDPHATGERRLAARLLGDAEPPGAEAALLDVLFSPDYFLAEAAADSLAKMYSRRSDAEIHNLLKRGGLASPALPAGTGDGDDWLVRSLEETGNRSRFRALVMRGLAEKYAAEPGVMPDGLAGCVWDGLLDGDRGLRLASVAAAGVSGSDLAPEKLSAFLYGENDSVLLAAALRAMAALRPPEFGEAVERHAAHADPSVAVEALAALAAMGYENAMFPPMGVPHRPSVAGFVNHPSTPVRGRAAEILAATGDPRAAEYLAFVLGDRVADNRAAAARALGALGFTSAIGALSPRLGDPNPGVRSAAAVALGGMGVVGVTARVLDDLESGDLPLRRAAAVTLGRLGDKRAIPYLEKAMGESDFELSVAATESLGRIGGLEAGPGLYRFMMSCGDVVRADAARRALTALYGGDDPGDAPSARESWGRRHHMGAAR